MHALVRLLVLFSLLNLVASQTECRPDLLVEPGDHCLDSGCVRKTTTDPKIPAADSLRSEWISTCAAENHGLCLGGLDSLNEPRLNLPRPLDEAGASLWDRLEELHSPSECFPSDSAERPRALVLRLGGLENACAYQGLWGKVQRLVGALAWAVAHNHMVVFQQTDNWIGVGPGWCPERSWLCFFEDLSPVCRHRDWERAIGFWQKNNLPGEAGPVFKPYGCLPAVPSIPGNSPSTEFSQIARFAPSPVLGWSACMHDNRRCSKTGSAVRGGIATDHQSNQFFGGDLYVPSDLRTPDSARGHLSLPVWWEAHLSRYLLRPRPFVRSFIQKSKESTHWPASGAVIGVHVRRGDKYDNSLDVQVFTEHYLPSILSLVESTGISHVFVASDSPHIIREIRAGSISTGTTKVLTFEQLEQPSPKPPYPLTAEPDPSRNFLVVNLPQVEWITFDKSQDQLPDFARFEDIPGDYSRSHWYRGLKGNERLTGNQFTANTLFSIRDVWLLSQCHHFVGTRVSAVSRFASVLLLGNRLSSKEGPKAHQAQLIWPSFPGINQYH